MIGVCKGRQSGFDMEKVWMNRALFAQFDYKGAYEELFKAWQPTWGGTHEAILAVGRQAIATKAFDTAAPEIMLLAFEMVTRFSRNPTGGPNPMWRDAQVWSDIQVLFEGDLKEPSRESVRDWDLTRYAAFAWKCGKNEQTFAILKRIKGQADAGVFQDITHESLDTVRKAMKGASDF